MSKHLPLKVLILEDQPTDAELMLDELRQSGFELDWQRVQTKAEYIAQLSPTLDIILADYNLPQFDGLTALTLLQASRLDIPFILVSGNIGEERAVAAMKQGVADYILKDRLARLGQAVVNALEAQKLRDQQRQAAALLRESEARYRTLVEQASDGIFIANSQGRYIQVNSAGCRLLGYTPEEILEKTISDLTRVDPNQPLRLDELRQGKTLITNREMIRKDGTLVPVEISAKQLSDEGFQGIVRDITERKRAENELRKLHTAVEQSGSSVIITDLQGTIEYANPKFTEVTGYAADEVIGKNPRILKSGETPAHTYKEMWDTIIAGNEWRGEFHNRKKNGELFWELASISPVKDETGRIINFLAVKEDITRRKQMEAELAQERSLLRTLIDSIPDRIYSKDAKGRFTLKNEADVHQMGAASTIEVIGKTDFDYYPVEIAEQYQADDQMVLESGIPLYEREEPVITASGTQGWMLTSKIPLRDAQGKVIGLVGIGRDITERKRSEEKLRKLNRTLAMLSDVNQAIVRIHNTAELFEKVCRIGVEQGGFRMVWVGLLDLETGRANPVADAGITEDYLEKLDIVLSDEKRANGPVGTALRSGKHVIVNDIEHDSRMIPWREDGLKLGYRAAAAFPLKVAYEVRGIFTVYADTPDFFDDDELKLLDEMANDISFAMEFAENESQRRQAETALRQHVRAVEEMRLFLQTTLDAFPANTIVLNPDGTIINANASWNRFADENSATSEMHYLGVNYLTVCDKSAGLRSEEAASTAAGIRAVIDASQDEFYLEYPCHSPSEKRWFRLNVTPFPEPAPRRVVVAHINITERRLAEEAEHEQRRFAEVMRDSLAALTASLDVDTIMQQILDYSGIAITCEVGTIVLFEEGRGRVAYTRGYSAEARAFFKDNPLPLNSSAFEMAYGSQGFYLVPDTKSTPNWVSFPPTDWIRSSIGVPIILGGKTIGLLIVDSGTPNRFQQKDVETLQTFSRYAAIALENAYHATELEEKVIVRTAELQTAKERVETILNSSTDAILLLHHDFTIQQTNGAFNAMFGCEQDDYFNKPLDVLLHSYDKSATTHILQAAAEHLRVSEDVEAQRKDGTVFTAELNIGYVNEESFVCAFHDVSVRKQVEQSLLAAVQKEKELNELKTRFVSMASHEFRTPLATILAATETLTAYRHRLTDDEIGRKLSNIVDQVGFLKNIMDDVLQLARLQARRFEYKPAKLDLDTFWQEILDEYRNRQDIQHQFHYTSVTNLPAVQVDKKLMRQIITNLLSNAIKYSSPDKLITIKLLPTDDGVAFSVQDGGIGIPQADLPHLFEPFHRADNVGTIHGTGLGLVIAKEAVDLHGGTITVESQIDVGTTFTINLPISSKEV